QDVGEELVKALEGLSPQDREKKLVEGAQKEGGAFSFYTSFNADDADAFKNAFVKKYPFVKVTTFRAGSGKLTDRIVTEARAGQFLWDVADVSADFTYAIQQAGVLAKYTSPVKEKIDSKLYDPEGYWTGVATEPVAIAWNTNLVKAGEAPKSYEELADPKWKGKFSLDTEDHNWALYILKTRGEKAGKELLTKLAANKPQMIRGRSQQLEMLVAGEFPLTVAMLEHRLVQYTSRGAPVGFAFVRPALVGLEGLYLSKKAPHPYTAVLFMDWILSDGQEMFVSQGRTGVVTKDVKYKYPRQGEGLSGDFIVIPPEDMAKNAEAIAKFFNETFGLTKTKQ
ncbi:MAG: extracellular solute-binding protein, partial [Actinobacteria bacterium]|nr:extracellular solute-binding protein [Actinomycetota bacterium]